MVVNGQRFLQTVSDSFLGTSVSELTSNHYYWRQLKDWKGGLDVESLDRDELYMAAELQGWTLARAHSRAGDPIPLSGYLGSDSTFDMAFTEFAVRYADQNDEDYQAFMAQLDGKRLESRDI